MKIKIIHTLFLLGLFVSLNAQSDIQRIAQIVQQKVNEEQFSGAVLVAKDGAPIYHESFGWKDDDKSAIDNHTQYCIASITKMLTAIVTLQLVEEQKLKLEDNLALLLPQLEIPKAKKITLHHLLLHISGLPNENDLMYLKKKSPEAFIKAVLSQRTKSPALGSFNYNNLDYMLLGLIIEKQSGKSWEENIQDRIIKPLELENTGFLSKGAYPQNYAWPYQINAQGKAKKDPAFHIENFYAAGNMYSNTMDLLKIDQALYGEQLLSEKSKALMFKSYPEYNYTGYSVWTYRYPFVANPPSIMERRGGILGANVVLIRLLDSQESIIILSNNDRFNPDSFGDKSNLREALIIALSENK